MSLLCSPGHDFLASLAKALVSLVHRSCRFSSSVQGSVLCSFYSQTSLGEFSHCQCSSTCNAGGSLIGLIGSQADVAHGGRGIVAAWPLP